MRVVSGKLGGRSFQAPNLKTVHPMSEKIRGSIFSSLGDVSNLKVLDAYSGSGSLSIEAISRGAIKSTAIELNPKAAKQILINLEELGINSQVKVIKAKIESWIKTSSSTFDLVFADPPYDNKNLEVLNSLSRHLNKNGLLVLSWPGKIELPNIENLKLINHKIFGDAQVGFYRF